jgi:hypothetical protein
VTAQLEAGKLAVPGLAAARLGLGAQLALKAGALRGHVTGEAGGVQSAGLIAGMLGIDGDLEARPGADSLVFRGGIAGRGLARGRASERALAHLRLAGCALQRLGGELHESMLAGWALRLGQASLGGCLGGGGSSPDGLTGGDQVSFHGEGHFRVGQNAIILRLC